MPSAQPVAPLSASRAAALACLAGCAVAGVLAAWLRVRLQLSPHYPGVVLATFVGVSVAVVGRLGRHHPHRAFGPANVVTLFRALLMALVAGFVAEAARPELALAAIVLAAVATAEDGIDGWLARRTGLASGFGARFDMEVDAGLILLLALLAWRHGKAGAWVIASGLLRYGFVAAGLALPWLTRPLFPSRRRQTACVVQIAGLIVALAPTVVHPVSAIVAGTTLAGLIGSFAVDTWWLIERRNGAVAED
ncbi:MAG: CDP-alcohol phosphatidyltransferase family protein [Vicinamibacterales bacterium]